MQTLTVQELNNVIALINKATINGAESTTVALLLQKLSGMAVELSTTNDTAVSIPDKKETKP